LPGSQALTIQFRLNLDTEIRQHRIDDEAVCFVADDFFENPQEIVEFADASRSRFEMPKRSYPGLVLDLDAASCDEVNRFMRFRMSRLFAYARSGLKTSAQISLTTLQPEAFSWIQRLCHTDPRPDTGRRNYALLVYLFREETLGGTGFYRWRDERFWQQMAALQLDDPNGGLEQVQARYPMFREAARYMTESNEAAELLTMVPAKFNRMICYSGEVPHSAYFRDAKRLSQDCTTGRLTLNAFANVIPLR
jgi:hypothetical protein